MIRGEFILKNTTSRAAARKQRPWYVIVAVLLLPLCSCQTLTPRGAIVEQAAPATQTPAPVANRRAAAPATPVAPVARVAMVPTASHQLRAQHRSAPTFVQQTSTVTASYETGFTGRPGVFPTGGCRLSYPPEMNCPPDAAADGQYPCPWMPDGLQGPWPYDEYIYDGGDRDVQVQVGPDWSVHGIDNEDTVVHYETRDGRTIVQPTNRVPIYAPRFAAVRRVTGVELNAGQERIAGVAKPLGLVSQESRLLATTSVQPVGPILQHGVKTTVNLREQQRGIGINNVQLIDSIDSGFLPYEDLSIIRRGQFDLSEKARLTERTTAANTWASHQMAQVVLDGLLAHEQAGTSAAQETFVYEMPKGRPRLQIVKIANKSEAQPGEEIEFTIRFDNIGDQRIGNVTIMDSLTLRLEYVEGSAQCSLKGNFYTQENEAESLVLRWEIEDPLQVGEGGLIRFKCRLK